MLHTNQTYTPSPAVRQAVQDSQHLLAYAIQSRVTLEHEVVQALTRAKNLLRQNAWTPEEEIEFWKAFTRLSASVKPVTIRSLKAVVPAPDRPSWLQCLTRARFFVNFYRLLALIASVLLVALLAYWVFGSGFINEIEGLIAKRQEMTKFEKAVQEKTEGDQPASQENLSPGEPVEEEISTLDKQLQATYNSLLRWSQYWQKALFFLFSEHTFEGRNVLLDEKLTRERISYLQREIETNKRLLPNIGEEQKSATKRRIEENLGEKLQLQRKLEEEKIRYEIIMTAIPSQFVLEVLQVYIFPLLCGFLGAAFYVLRSLTDEIENVTYTIGSDIRYELRLTLGALGGLGIGWFLIPEGSSGVQAVSPLALSFLVGYHIDLFFSIMDGLIESISKAESKAESTPPATPANTEPGDVEV